MLFKEINQKYTEKVSEYLGKGLTINTATMSGSQGEIAKIDLTDGKDIYRVMLDRFNIFGCNDDHRSYEGIRLVVGRCQDSDVKPDEFSEHETIWNQHLELVECEMFYQIGYDSDYYGDIEEAKAAYDKRIERYRANGMDCCSTIEEDITSEKTISIVEPLLKDYRCVSRINRREVTIKRYTTRRTGKRFYRVFYYSNEYDLH